MKIINELIQIITKKKAKSIKIIELSQAGRTKINIFYEGVLKKKLTTDEESALFLFNSPPNNSAYKNLKVELTERLINSLFFIKLKQPNYSERQLAFFYCCKYLAAAKILRYLLSVEASINLFKRVYKRACKYELSEFVVECSKHLGQYYAFHEGDEDKFNYYHQLMMRHKAIVEAENLGEELYLRLIIPYVKKKAIKEDTYEIAKNYLEQLEKKLEIMDSPRLYFFKFYVEIIMFLSINDYPNIIKASRTAIHYFEQKPYIHKVGMNTALIYEVSCHLQLKQFEKGKALEGKTLQLLREGAHNWFNNRGVYFVLAMHALHYLEAYTIYNEVTNHRKFKALPSNSLTKELWRIYGAYLHFLHEMRKLKETPLTKFKLGKFINSVPQTAKDRNSLNISILIIQTLFLIIRKDADGIIDRIEATEKYSTRYIKTNQNRRSNLFIKMLLKIGAAGFNKSILERQVQKYYNELITIPSESVNQPYLIEIIPYESLWEMVMESI